MFEYEIEVIGQYSSVISVMADSQEEAEALAISEFEQDFSPYSANGGWSDAWGSVDVEGVISSTEESDEY